MKYDIQALADSYDEKYDEAYIDALLDEIMEEVALDVYYAAGAKLSRMRVEDISENTILEISADTDAEYDALVKRELKKAG